jgi:hypothetical protein
MTPNKLIILFLISSLSASADIWTFFIRYKPEPEFSRIIISHEVLRGERAVEQISANSDAYEELGIYHTHIYGKFGSKLIEKVTQMDGHEIRTEIKIYYPRINGYQGALSHSYLKVYVDGALRLDIPFGHILREDFDANRVVVHVEEEIIEVYLSPESVPLICVGLADEGEVLELKDLKKASRH